MDVKDVQKVTQLSGEERAIRRALEVFSAGGKIVSVAIAPAETPTGSIGGIHVPVHSFPQSAVDAIKKGLEERLGAIADELKKMGITGVETPKKAAPAKK